MTVLMTKRWVASALALFFCACTDSPEHTLPPRAQDDVLTEHRPLQAAQPTGKLGDDCTQSGASNCLSGLCLHTRPEHNKGYVCSQRCQSSSECPRDWSCVSFYSSTHEHVCIPPSLAQSQPSHP